MRKLRDDVYSKGVVEIKLIGYLLIFAVVLLVSYVLLADFAESLRALLQKLHIIKG